MKIMTIKKLISNTKLITHFNYCNRFLSSSSSSGGNGIDDTIIQSQHQQQQQQKSPTNNNQNSSIKFQNILNYLEKSIPLFIDDYNIEEYKEFNRAINHVRQCFNTSPEMSKFMDTKINDDNNLNTDLKNFLRDRYLYSRSSILTDGSLSCLMYPDLGLCNKILPEKFLLDFIVASILGTLDYLDNNENLQYSRTPSLGRDYIEDVSIAHSEPKTNYITISYDWNYYLIDLDQFENTYQALWQILKFLFESSKTITKLKNPYPMGVLSTLPRNDCMYGYKFLNEIDLQKIRQSKLLISIEKFEIFFQQNHQQQLSDEYESNNNRFERDHRLSLMAKQLLLSNQENIGNRWYDKSIQMIFVLNKNLDQLYSHGLCFEQSHAKIESILQLMDHSIKFLTKFKPKPNDETKSYDIQFKKLQLFDSSSKRLTEIINQATNHFAMEKYLNITSNKYFQLSMLQFNDYGLNLLENEFAICSDDWIQIAFNMTMYKMTGQIRPCYQRFLPNGGDNDHDAIGSQWFQCMNNEMLEYFNDSSDRQKLLLALESMKFHRKILMNHCDENNSETLSSTKESNLNNIESLLLVYQNLGKFPFGNELNKYYPELANNIELLFKLKSLKRLRRSTIQITTLKPAQNYYDWHLVMNGHPYYDHRINLTAHLALDQIHFTLTMLRCNNDQLLRTINIDKILYELEQSLKKLKFIFQS